MILSRCRDFAALPRIAVDALRDEVKNTLQQRKRAPQRPFFSVNFRK